MLEAYRRANEHSPGVRDLGMLDTAATPQLGRPCQSHARREYAKQVITKRGRQMLGRESDHPHSTCEAG